MVYHLEPLEVLTFHAVIHKHEVGVVCYLCLSDKFPFNSKSRQDLFQQIVDGNYTFPPASWDTVSEDAKDFINGMLTVNPENRPSAEKVLQHEWLATARRSKIIGRPKFEVTDDTEKLDNQLAALKTMNALENLKRATLSKQKEVIKTFIASQLLLSDEKKAINAVFRELGMFLWRRVSRFFTRSKKNLMQLKSVLGRHNMQRQTLQNRGQGCLFQILRLQYG